MNLARTCAKLLARALALPIHVYRLAISPYLGANCRFQPTCSAYALEALEVHGPVRGTWLAVRRLLRCHPIKWLGGGHGYDPVPAPRVRTAPVTHLHSPGGTSSCHNRPASPAPYDQRPKASS